MKYVLMMSALLGVSLLGYAQSPIASLSEAPAVRWDDATHDFGTIPYRQPQSAEFTLVNQSSQPVVITQATGSCGCTVASYTEGAIAPGEKGTVKATYDAAKPGAFNKTVSVTTSASKDVQILRIKGVVVE